jgi:predicted DNA-binding transcriptional regulator AlpA
MIKTFNPVAPIVESATAAASLQLASAQVTKQAYSVPEFCRAFSISRQLLYSLWSKGIGPKAVHIGKRKILIPADEATKWLTSFDKKNISQNA